MTEFIKQIIQEGLTLQGKHAVRNANPLLVILSHEVDICKGKGFLSRSVATLGVLDCAGCGCLITNGIIALNIYLTDTGKNL